MAFICTISASGYHITALGVRTVPAPSKAGHFLFRAGEVLTFIYRPSKLVRCQANWNDWQHTPFAEESWELPFGGAISFTAYISTEVSIFWKKGVHVSPRLLQYLEPSVLPRLHPKSAHVSRPHQYVQQHGVSLKITRYSQNGRGLYPMSLLQLGLLQQLRSGGVSLVEGKWLSGNWQTFIKAAKIRHFDSTVRSYLIHVD